MTPYSQTNPRAGPALSADAWRRGGGVFDACCQGGHSCSLNPSLCPRCHGPTAACGVDSSGDGRCCHLSPAVYHQPFTPAAQREASACFWPSGFSLTYFCQQPRALLHQPCCGRSMWWSLRALPGHSNVWWGLRAPWRRYRAHLPVPHILILLQAYGSAWALSHTSPPLASLSKCYLQERKVK